MTDINETQGEHRTMTAEDLLSLRNRPPTELFEIPGIGTVTVHGLSNLEAHQWRQSCSKDDAGRISDDYADAKLIVRCLRDDQGQRILTDKHVTQIVELPELIVNRLVAICMKLCGNGDEAEETILKNYGTTDTGSS